MCDYIYLDGNYSGDTRWNASTNMLSWTIDPRRLRHKKENQKIFVSVQQITFVGVKTGGATTAGSFVSELVTNLNLKDCYNTYGNNSDFGRYNVLMMCDIYYNGAVMISSNTSNNNNNIKFEVDIFDNIQLGVSYLNEYVDLSGDVEHFKCLLKFEYEDIN